MQLPLFPLPIALLSLLLLISLLTNTPAAAEFSGFHLIAQRHGFFGTGCDLRIASVCGCTDTIRLERYWSCAQLDDTYTQRLKHCGGARVVFNAHKTGAGRHSVRFEGKDGCSTGCSMDAGPLVGAKKGAREWSWCRVLGQTVG